MGKRRKKRLDMTLKEVIGGQILEESFLTLGFEYLSNMRSIRNHLTMAQQFAEGIVTSKNEGADEEMVSEFQQISNDIAGTLEKLKKAEISIIDKQDVIDHVI